MWGENHERGTRERVRECVFTSGGSTASRSIGIPRATSAKSTAGSGALSFRRCRKKGAFSGALLRHDSKMEPLPLGKPHGTRIGGAEAGSTSRICTGGQTSQPGSQAGRGSCELKELKEGVLTP